MVLEKPVSGELVAAQVEPGLPGPRRPDAGFHEIAALASLWLPLVTHFRAIAA